MRYVTTLALLLLLPVLALADGPRPDAPRWSLELKGGVLSPAVDNWSRYYGSSYMKEFGGSLAWKPERHLEIGIEGSYAGATGKGELPLHAQQGAPLPPSGKVTFSEAPLNLFILARGVFSEDQLLVPYLGGGYSRVFYRTKVEGGDKRSGSVNGYHARGGVQILLDGVEPEASENLYQEFGIHHCYLFVEGRHLKADAETASGGSVDIGGTSWLGGLLFEF